MFDRKRVSIMADIRLVMIVTLFLARMLTHPSHRRPRHTCHASEELREVSGEKFKGRGVSRRALQGPQWGSLGNMPAMQLSRKGPLEQIPLRAMYGGLQV